MDDTRRRRNIPAGAHSIASRLGKDSEQLIPPSFFSKQFYTQASCVFIKFIIYLPQAIDSSLILELWWLIDFEPIQIPPLPLNYEADGLKAAVRYQMPTLSLDIDFCSDIRAEKWLLTRTHMRWMHNDRFDENFEILDESGKIVATCKQSCVIFPVQRPGPSKQPKSQL